MKIKKGETYAEFIKRVRNATKLTQVEFGKRLGYSSVTISKWERGANVPLYSQRVVDEFANTLK